MHTLRDQFRSDLEYRLWNPNNSPAWHENAMKAAVELSGVMGYEAYCAWIDAGPEPASWKNLHELVTAKLEELQKGGVAENHT